MIENFLNQVTRPIGKQFLGSIVRYESTPESHTFIFNDIHSALEVRVYSDEIIRVRLAPHSVFLDDFSYALQPYPFTNPTVTFAEMPNSFIISTAVVRCVVLKENFKIQFIDIESEQVMCEDNNGVHWEENYDYGGYNVFCTKLIQFEENFYGLGDKASDLNLIHKSFTLWSTDAYAFERNTDPLYRNYPFYTGLHHGLAYGIFFDNTYKSYFDFGTWEKSSVTFCAEGGEMRYYYIHGPHMMDITKRFAHLTGTPPMPPMWALGYHQCRWSYYPEAKVRDLADQFRKREIPCDAIYLDIDYMDGYRCFTWNKIYFPDPKKMVSDLKKDGFKMVVIIDPGIKTDNDYWVYTEGAEKGYFCRRGDDYFMEGPVWPGRCQFPDFTNPAVRDWWGTLFKGLLDDGIAGVWNDMNEPSIFGSGTFPNDVRHHYDGYRGSHRKAHNIYGMQMVRATYEGIKKIQKNKRPFTITRSAYAGTQRYAAAWTGDNIATWEHLYLANVQCQRMSMSGFSFCGSDIGGFTGEPDAELFVRWIQLGAFSPLMRAHSAGDTREREPWSYGPEVEAICKKFIELRYKLLPYIYSVFWENHKYGFPMLRPVIMMEQELLSNTYRQDEFTFGDKILICPILHQGAVGRTVYLPKGSWYYYWDNKIYIGQNGEQWVPAPLDTMPLFVRAGSVIPEYPVMQYVGQFELKEMTLTMYYADYLVNSFMYEDHGDTFAYEQDIYTEKKFALEGNATSVKVQQSAQGQHTPRYDTYKIRFIGLPFAAKSVLSDGKPVREVEIDADGVVTFVVLKSFEMLEIIAQ